MKASMVFAALVSLAFLVGCDSNPNVPGQAVVQKESPKGDWRIVERWDLMSLGPGRWFDLSVSSADGSTSYQWASLVTTQGVPMYVKIGTGSGAKAKFVPSDEPPCLIKMTRGDEVLYQLIGPMGGE